MSLFPELTAEEVAPYATSYITSDVPHEPAFRATECFGKRLTNGDKKDTKRASFLHEFSVKREGTIADDAAYCVQCFCELLNHKKERCSHRCGFAAFGLRGLYQVWKDEGKTMHWADMSDNGPTPGTRGRAAIRVVDPSALAKLFEGDSERRGRGGLSLVGAPTDGGGGAATLLHQAREYYGAIDEIFRSMSPTDQKIIVPKLPIYMLSGGATMPVCAFIQFPGAVPPLAPQEYSVNAMAIALRRNLPNAASDEERIKAFCDEGGDWNWKASVLMDAATLLAVSFPYLYDYAISGRARVLTTADEFVRTGRITFALDCEDGAVETLVFLWHVLVDEPSCPLMETARAVRMQYVVTICLKAVTRPAESDESAAATLAAHASCDMVPLLHMRKMLGGVFSDIADERHLKESGMKLRTVVGETTGYVRPYLKPGEGGDVFSRKAVRDLVTEIFESARLVSAEDLSVGSGFYKYAVSALVHDTLVSPAAQKAAQKAGVHWLVPQIVYVAGKTKTYGVPHEEYVMCSENVTAVAVKPVSLAVADLIAHLSKFEHPIPPLKIADEASFPNYRAVKDILREFSGGGAGDSDVIACVPLHEMDESSATRLAIALRESGKRVKAFVELVAEDVATVVLHVS